MMDAVATLVSGSISGAVADAITHPISTVKTRLQVQGAAAAMGEGGVAKMALYRGPVHATSAIIKSEGVFALYTGLGAVLAAAAPGQALYFGGYEALKGALPQHPLSSFAAGVGAQLCGSIAWVPMDVVKERLQIQGSMTQLTARYQGSVGALRSIIASEGVLGLYRAYWIHQMTWAPFNGLYFMIYDGTKGFAQKRSLPEWPAAIVAGVVASTVTNPMDLVKTRLQVARSNPELFDYTGTVDCATKIVRREGPAALMDGAGSRVLLLTPRLSIAVGTYEFVRSRFFS
jgi:hypothetical protein